MSRAFATTLYPRSRNDWATPAPMPCEAPVAMTVFCLLAISASLAVVKIRDDANSSNSVVAGISTLGPIVSRLFRDIRNPGNGLHILQAKFHGHQQTERCSMIHAKGLTVEVCGEQRLWMAGRRQVERHKVRVRITRDIEFDGRLHTCPFGL